MSLTWTLISLWLLLQFPLAVLWSAVMNMQYVPEEISEQEE